MAQTANGAVVETIPQIVARRVDESNKQAAQPLIDRIIAHQRNIKAMQADITKWQKELNEIQQLSATDVTGS